jgi:hypothetical protein
MQNRICKICNVEKPIDDFPKTKGHYLWSCKACEYPRVAAYSRAKRAKAREERKRIRAAYVPPGIKACKKCGVERPLEEFPKSKSMMDGHTNLCRPCTLEYERAWKMANPDKVKANSERTRRRVVVLPPDTTQACKRCRVEKLLSEFAPAPGMTLGVRKTCIQCLAEKQRQKYWANPEAGRAKGADWRKNNPLKVIKMTARSYAKHKVKRNKQRSEYRLKNIEHERERERNYTKNNHAKVAAKKRRREAAELQATPLWLTPIQNAMMEEFYEMAAAKRMQTGTKYHVDHIVPLQGKGVRGLHVPWNLQILTESENCSKQNKFIEGSA